MELNQGESKVERFEKIFKILTEKVKVKTKESRGTGEKLWKLLNWKVVEIGRESRGKTGLTTGGLLKPKWQQGGCRKRLDTLSR